MPLIRNLMAIAIACTCFVTAAEPTHPQERAPLFPAQGFDDWLFDVNGEQQDVPPAFTAFDGQVRIPGNPRGALLTEGTFGQYTLSYQWRWPKGAGNSGVLVHASGANVQWGWPKCIEPQLQAGNAGDLFCIGGYRVRQAGSDKPQQGGNAKNWSDNAERQAGQWNTMHIVCQGKTIEVYVNGTLINRGFDCETDHGKLGFQSEEGKPMDIRHATLGPAVLTPKKEIDLLAGDLELGWSLGAVDPKAFAKAATLKDGVLTLSPDSPTPLRTVQRYKDYELTLKFRWPKEKGQAKLLLHSNTAKAGRGFTDDAQFNLADANHKPGDQWNTLVVRCVGDQLTFTLNGSPAGQTQSPEQASGMIGLQTSGAALQIGRAVVSPVQGE